MKRQNPSAYGGILLNTRAGRSRPRPLSSSSTMHLVLRSTKAKGEWSFRRDENAQKIKTILEKFAKKHEVKLHSVANVGNHLHLHIFLKNKASYKPFIRAITAAIAMAITTKSRWQKAKAKFWDYRPFTRIVMGVKDYLGLKDYIAINQLEAQGYSRANARLTLAWRLRANTS